MPIGKLKPTNYLALDVMAAALERAYPDFAPKESWRYYQEIIPDLVERPEHLAKRLRRKQGDEGESLEQLQRRVLERNVESPQERRLRNEYCDEYFRDPFEALLCHGNLRKEYHLEAEDARDACAAPGGGAAGCAGDCTAKALSEDELGALVESLLADDDRLYELLTTDPFFECADASRGGQDAAFDGQEDMGLLSRLAERFSQAGYTPRAVDGFFDQANRLYRRIDGKSGAGKAEAMKDAYRYLLNCAVRGIADQERYAKGLPQTMAWNEESCDGAGFSNPRAAHWQLSELAGRGANLTQVASWDFAIGDTVVFGRDFKAQARDRKTPCSCAGMFGAPREAGADANAYTVKALPSNSHISRQHALIRTRKGPVLTLYDRKSSCGTMVIRGDDRFYLGAHPAICASSRLARQRFQSLDLVPGDVVVLGLDVVSREGRIIAIEPLSDSLLFRVTVPE